MRYSRTGHSRLRGLTLCALLSTMYACGSTDFTSNGGGISRALGKSPDSDKSKSEDDSADATVDPAAADIDQYSEEQLNGDERIDNGGSLTEPSLGLSEAVVFGDDQVFRIGDGQASSSSCRDSIKAYDLKGTTYYFNFDVAADATNVEIKVEQMCGIDISGTSTAAVYTASGAVETQKIAPKQARLEFAKRSFNKGSYFLKIKTVRIGDGIFQRDIDDFIVGKIKIYADKKIIPGEVRAEK